MHQQLVWIVLVCFVAFVSVTGETIPKKKTNVDSQQQEQVIIGVRRPAVLQDDDASPSLFGTHVLRHTAEMDASLAARTHTFYRPRPQPAVPQPAPRTTSEEQVSSALVGSSGTTPTRPQYRPRVGAAGDGKEEDQESVEQQTAEGQQAPSSAPQTNIRTPYHAPRPKNTF